MPADARTDAAQYEALRARLMPVVFSAHPRSADAIPRTLHKIMHGLDSYEVLESVLASVCGNGHLSIHAEINSTANTAKYGIHPQSHTASLALVQSTEPHATAGPIHRATLPVVRKGGSARAWELPVHRDAPRDAAVLPWEGCPCDEPDLRDWWQFTAPGGSLFVPNAAFLLVDIRSRFDHRWWK